MSISYSTQQGDTIAGLARRFYGDPSRSSLILRANPGLAEPLRPGLTVIIPSAPQLGAVAPLDGPDEVAIAIGGGRFRYWSEFTLTRSIDAVSSFTLTAPLERENAVFRRTFRPFSYAPVSVQIGGERVHTGTLLHVNPTLSDESRTVICTGYGLPGVLGDCNAPPSLYPLEYFGADLGDIAREVCAPFGLNVVFTSDPGARFDVVDLGPTQAIWAFLSGLAGDRDLLVADNANGAITFGRPDINQPPVAKLVDGQSPVDNVAANFDPQRYFSDITGIDAYLIGLGGANYTVKNPRLQGVLRPHTFTVSDSYEGDTITATEANAARMFAEAATYTVQLVGWRTPSGRLWAPGQVVELAAPDAMIYTSFRFLIRSVELTARGDQRVAELTLVIPESFTGQQPERLPWD